MPLVCFVVTTLLAGCANAPGAWRSVSPRAVTPPAIPTEFRAVWVATVANIDWPSTPGLDPTEQQAEAIGILDEAARLGLNAVVLQVRPHGDALYRSSLEPWSSYLTGSQGEDPGYDPLEFWVEHAHARGLELHAWFNPFRASHPSDPSAIHASHIARRRPDLVRDTGQYLWLDPAEPEARAHSLAVIADVVDRYDIDGVHLDDYFYPYPSDEHPFPDDTGYEAFVAAGGTEDRGAWRRSHINAFVEELARVVRDRAPNARVGISPFGIWRPGHPQGIVGFDAYEGLAADARLWVQAGWLDYVSPQLYWTIDSEGQPFGPLLDWWQSIDARERGVWPGLYLTRIKADGGWSPDEIEAQIELLRSRGAGGFILFSMIGLSEDRQGVAGQLADTVFAEAAVVPEPWFGAMGTRPARPAVRVRNEGGRLVIRWEAGPRDASRVFRWAVSDRTAAGWRTRILPAGTQSIDYANSEAPLESPDAVVIRAVGRFGSVSEPAVVARVRP